MSRLESAPSPKYTAEFKQKVVELYRKSSTTYAEVARRLGCDPSSLSDWIKKADGPNAFGPSARYVLSQVLGEVVEVIPNLTMTSDLVIPSSTTALTVDRQLGLKQIRSVFPAYHD